MPEQRGSVRKRGYGEASTPWENPQRPARDVTRLQLCPCLMSVRIKIYVDRYLRLRPWLAGRLEGPPVVPVSHARLVGSHGAASSSHSACLAFFWERDEGPSSVMSAFHRSLLRSHAGLKIYCPSAWCKENSPVLSHTDPDVAGEGGRGGWK